MKRNKRGFSVTATTGFRFNAAHRLDDREVGDCQSIHGHNYEVIATITRRTFEDGMILDFRTFRSVFQNWLDRMWDHALLYEKGDKTAMAVVKAFNIAEHGRGGTWRQKFYELENAPTCENLATHIAIDVLPKVFADYNVEVRSVQVIEGGKSWATCHVDAMESRSIPLTMGATDG